MKILGFCTHTSKSCKCIEAYEKKEDVPFGEGGMVCSGIHLVEKTSGKFYCKDCKKTFIGKRVTKDYIWTPLDEIFKDIEGEEWKK